MIPHIAGRAVTRKRWPNGVDEPSVLREAAGQSPRRTGWTAKASPTDRARRPIRSSTASTAWRGSPSRPRWKCTCRSGGSSTGKPGTRHAAGVRPRPRRGRDDAAAVRGGRGRPRPDGRHRADDVPAHQRQQGPAPVCPARRIRSARAAPSVLAKRVAQQLEKAMPKLVTSTMTKSLRAGKVFLDWSQNNGSKTTIAPYSLRGREQPTVAAPRTWDEIEDPELRHLRFDEVLERVAEHGDLLAAARRADARWPTGSRRTAACAMRRKRLSRCRSRSPQPATTTASSSRSTTPVGCTTTSGSSATACWCRWAVPKNLPGHTGGQPPGRAHRGPPAGVPDVRGHDSQGRVRRREDDHLGHRHLRDREVQRQPARRTRQGRRGDRHPARRAGSTGDTR